MPNNIVLTADQFQALLQTITANKGNENGGNDRELPPTMSGNFAGCKSRFSGARGENVEAFIDAILIYKDCVNVSDENALKGLPMLFDGMAAAWWQGAKASNMTWEDAITSLRHSFGERKPNFKICLELGHVRSQCPKVQWNHEKKPASLSVLATNFDDENSRPMLEITIAGLHGLALVDTCGKRNVAGQKLYQYFREIDIPCSGNEEMMTMADGIARFVQTETFVVDVELRGVLFQVSFTAVPEHLESKTLLGVPFIKKTGIVLNIPQMQWCFTQNPNVVYKLEREPVNMSNTIMVNAMQIEELRPEEGMELTEEESEELGELLLQNTDVFENQAVPIPYAEHRITLTSDEPKALPPYRLSSPCRTALEEGINRKLENQVIEECESSYASSVVMVPKKEDRFRVARPLVELTKKKISGAWGKFQEDAFIKLKYLLANASVSRQANPTLPYVLRTDASSYGIGGCLLQGEGADERPVEYNSQIVTEAKRNYSSTEREAVAVVHSVQKFRGYLEGMKVKGAHDKWSSLLPSKENCIIEITPYLDTIAETLKDAQETSEHQQDKAKRYDNMKRRPRERWKSKMHPFFEVASKDLRLL